MIDDEYVHGRSTYATRGAPGCAPDRDPTAPVGLIKKFAAISVTKTDANLLINTEKGPVGDQDH